MLPFKNEPDAALLVSALQRASQAEARHRARDQDGALDGCDLQMSLAQECMRAGGNRTPHTRRYTLHVDRFDESVDHHEFEATLIDKPLWRHNDPDKRVTGGQIDLLEIGRGLVDLGHPDVATHDAALEFPG